MVFSCTVFMGKAVAQGAQTLLDNLTGLKNAEAQQQVVARNNKIYTTKRLTA